MWILGKPRRVSSYEDKKGGKEGRKLQCKGRVQKEHLKKLIDLYAA